MVVEHINDAIDEVDDDDELLEQYYDDVDVNDNDIIDERDIEITVEIDDDDEVLDDLDVIDVNEILLNILIYETDDLEYVLIYLEY